MAYFDNDELVSQQLSKHKSKIKQVQHKTKRDKDKLLVGRVA